MAKRILSRCELRMLLTRLRAQSMTRPGLVIDGERSLVRGYTAKTLADMKSVTGKL